MYPDHSNQALFVQYIEICKQALDQNKGKFPYAQIWAAVQAHNSGARIRVRVTGGRHESDFLLSLHEDDIKVSPAGDAQRGPKSFWNISRAYLEQVVQDPEPYVANPAKLNWEWLQDCMGKPYLSLQGNPEEQAEHANSAS